MKEETRAALAAHIRLLVRLLEQDKEAAKAYFLQLAAMLDTKGEQNAVHTKE